MDIMDIANQLLKEKVGDSLDEDTIFGAIKALFGEAGDSSINIKGLVDKMSSDSFFGEIVGSWLGDGDNFPIDKSGVAAIFNEDQIDGFASKLGIDSDSAASLLSDVVPTLIDKSSRGGSLLDSIGGAEDLFDMAKKFF